MSSAPSETSLRFRDDGDKFAFLEAVPWRDARDPRILAAARALRAVARGDQSFAHLAHALARDCIRYQTDTARVGREHIRPGSVWEDYERGVDDCDAKARLFCAVCIAGSLPARVVPRWTGGRLSHVSAEVQIFGSWVPVELTVARARLGDVAEDVPVETETGKWARP